MAELRLTLAGGLALTIPARTVKTRQSVPLGFFPSAPTAGCLIRYRVGTDLRVRALDTTYDELATMIAADRTASSGWFEVETADEQVFAFFPKDVDLLEELDPEAPGSRGCTALIDLRIDGEDNFVIPGLLAKADPLEIQEARSPSQERDLAGAPTRAKPKSPRKTN